MHLDLNGDKFSLQGLTLAINEIVEVPTVVGDLGIFSEEGITTTSFSIEKGSHSLSLVKQSQRGGPGQTVGGDGRNIRNFNVPHFQRDDGVNADEVQGVRAFGTEDTLETIESRITAKMARHTRDFDFTNELMRLGAVKGIVLDAEGNTILNCFTEWGIAAPTAVDFLLGTATTDVRAKCTQVLDAIEDGLEGMASSTRVLALAGDGVFAKLVEHAKVRETYLNWEAAANYRQDARQPFEFGGISWKRIHSKPKAKAANGGASLIGTNEIRFVPLGVPDMFIGRFAPADYNETVNTVGLPRYAKMLERKNGKGYDIEMQTNPLFMCTMPQGLQSGLSSN